MLQELTDRVQNISKRFGLRINREKTKTMTIGKTPEKMEVTLEGEMLEQVTESIYLGSLILRKMQNAQRILGKELVWSQ